jgi:hypothetical protein
LVFSWFLFVLWLLLLFVFGAWSFCLVRCMV